jgi:hypothetical protein
MFWGEDERHTHIQKKIPFSKCHGRFLGIIGQNPSVSKSNTVNVQDWSLQWPSNAIWPFKVHLSQNNLSKCSSKLKMKMSLEVPNIICPLQEPTSARHCHYKKYNQMVDSWFFTLHWRHVPYRACTSLIWVWYFIFCILGLTTWIQTNPSTERL